MSRARPLEGGVWRAARAVVAALALLPALAAHAQVDAQTLAALDAARAEAMREYTSPLVAAAAYWRLERMREPLFESGDPRAAIWLADAAEDALTIGLALDDCGVRALLGVANPQELQRATDLLHRTLVWTQRADELARNELAQGVLTAELATRLDGVERAQRIPLLRSVAAVWAAQTGAIPARDAPAVLDAAVTRLRGLLPNLHGPAHTMATLAAGMGLAQLGRAEDARGLLRPLLVKAGTAGAGGARAGAQPEPGVRVLAAAALARAGDGDPAAQRRALAATRARLAPELDDHWRLLLGDAEFRLWQIHQEQTQERTPSTANAGERDSVPPWQGWLDALEACTPVRRSGVRQAVLERIAQWLPDDPAPVPRLARAMCRLRDPESRQEAADELAELLQVHGDGTNALHRAEEFPPSLRMAAEFELGRAELNLGRARSGAVRLLRFAKEHGADPSSRSAIETTVLAARALGDPALLSTALATAVELFPDHPEHGAWRVEATALALSPDAAALVERQSAPRRYAHAIEAMERAKRTGVRDPALMADLVAAAAEAANEMNHAHDALSLLDRLTDPAGGGLEGIPPDLRNRLLEERVAALAQAGQSILSDRWVATEHKADPQAIADTCARVLRRQIPTDLAGALIDPPDPALRARIVSMAEAVQQMAPPAPQRDEVILCALLLGQLPDAALPVARRVLVAQGERADTLLALAEALYTGGDQAALAEAMPIYTRLARALPEGTPAWWVAELRRLQILERVNRNTEVIAPRVARLQAAHPDLGGGTLKTAFLALAARHEGARPTPEARREE